MSEHSPGPWQVIGNPPTEILSMADTEEGSVIADTQLMHGEPTPRQLADARLIAAAPEMLALLSDLQDDLVRYSKMASEAWPSAAIAWGSYADQIGTVIAKATGEASGGG